MSDALACPLPHGAPDFITLAHGGGGRHAEQLLATVFRPAFANAALDAAHDGAVVDIPTGRLALSTDAHVVHPLFFPGGNIGKLAVFGTVNDLAMCAARPRALTASFILEESLPVADLVRVVEAMAQAAAEAGVAVVAGDTKVVEKGKGDGVFISTAGVGERLTDPPIDPRRVAPGDVVLLSGDLGRHGMALLAVRERLDFDPPLVSDCACLWPPVAALVEAGLPLHALRDATRGGLATTLHEIAVSADVQINLAEEAVPVDDAVRGACEILGLDPLYVANEGRFAVIVPADAADEALAVLRAHDVSAGAVRVGEVSALPHDAADRGGRLVLRNPYGIERRLDLLSGEQLPRIC